MSSGTGRGRHRDRALGGAPRICGRARTSGTLSDVGRRTHGVGWTSDDRRAIVDRRAEGCWRLGSATGNAVEATSQWASLWLSGSVGRKTEANKSGAA